MGALSGGGGGGPMDVSCRIYEVALDVQVYSLLMLSLKLRYMFNVALNMSLSFDSKHHEHGP